MNCPVCLRNNIIKPIHEHDVEHWHFKATLLCLDGWWMNVRDEDCEAEPYWETSLHNIEVFYESGSTDLAEYDFRILYWLRDYWRMAYEVGGSVKAKSGRWLCPNFNWTEYDTPEEAVVRAYMDWLWKEKK